MSAGTATELLAIADALSSALRRLRFPAPVAHVYHPLVYAHEPYAAFVRRYAFPRVPVLLLGMNPGPFGMAQTGVPFGDVAMVRDWLHIEGRVRRPRREHPRRPVDGFACPRQETSGRRFWGWARERFGAPERFFARFFVANYCPLLFLEASGRNLTPERLPREARERLYPPCDRALRRTVARLEPRWVVGIGRFAEEQARRVLESAGGVTIGRIPHPSPASPAANRGWAQDASRALRELGITL